jgi:hypothetical protein
MVIATTLMINDFINCHFLYTFVIRRTMVVGRTVDSHEYRFKNKHSSLLPRGIFLKELFVNDFYFVIHETREGIAFRFTQLDPKLKTRCLCL